MKKKVMLVVSALACMCVCACMNVETSAAELLPATEAAPAVVPAAADTLNPVVPADTLTPVVPAAPAADAVVPVTPDAAPQIDAIPVVDDTPTVLPEVTVPAVDPAIAAQPVTTAPTAGEILGKIYGPRYTVGAVNADNNANLFILGDSRTVMGALDTGYDARANWFAASGTTLDYMLVHFAPILDAKDLNGKTIVIMYGVNDVMFTGPDCAKMNYRMFLMTKAQEWIQKGAKVYMASVPGVTSQLDFAAPGMSSAKINMDVSSFNDFTRATLPTGVNYLPVSLIHPMAYDDGLHYTAEESMLLYENIINQLAH